MNETMKNTRLILTMGLVGAVILWVMTLTKPKKPTKSPDGAYYLELDGHTFYTVNSQFAGGWALCHSFGCACNWDDDLKK